MCLPRTQGWSGPPHGVVQCARVPPTHAGVVGARISPAGRRGCASHARRGGRLAHASAARSGRCLPRAQGWSGLPQLARTARAVPPTHAGVVGSATTARTTSRGCASHARRGGRFTNIAGSARLECLPRTQGWSGPVEEAAEDDAVPPMHAGVVGRSATRTTPTTCAAHVRRGGRDNSCVASTTAVPIVRRHLHDEDDELAQRGRRTHQTDEDRKRSLEAWSNA